MKSPDESGRHAFEFRRQLGVIHARAVQLEDESLGPLTPDQRDAVEEIVEATLKLTAETAQSLETGDEGRSTPGDEVAVDESTASLEPSTPPDSIVLAIGDDEEFVAALEAQFERAGYVVRGASDDDDLRAALDRSRPQHLILDCRFPSGRSLEGLERTLDDLDDDTSVTLVSTVAGDHPGPLQGIAGVLAATVAPDALERLFENRFGLPINPSASDPTAIAVVGDVDDRLLETLDELDRRVTRDTVSTEELDAVEPSDVDCVFLSEAAIDAVEESTLATLRSPIEEEAVPLVAIGPTPTDGEWVPITGRQTFAQTPITAAELAATVLAAIEPSPSERQ
ncbi:hypothetical protein [Halosolutus gelatinilyticus]|uniref:hypothetical protein n=1 Tax=Halosolutus gelatinilyticus TaxID=2931975 RepID=UPI001FF41624|nr:hypothetical protein [Halosolutus gelatinilyticus]